MGRRLVFVVLFLAGLAPVARADFYGSPTPRYEAPGGFGGWVFSFDRASHVRTVSYRTEAMTASAKADVTVTDVSFGFAWRNALRQNYTALTFGTLTLDSDEDRLNFGAGSYFGFAFGGVVGQYGAFAHGGRFNYRASTHDNNFAAAGLNVDYGETLFMNTLNLSYGASLTLFPGFQVYGQAIYETFSGHVFGFAPPPDFTDFNTDFDAATAFGFGAGAEFVLVNFLFLDAQVFVFDNPALSLSARVDF